MRWPLVPSRRVVPEVPPKGGPNLLATGDGPHRESSNAVVPCAFVTSEGSERADQKTRVDLQAGSLVN